MPHHEVDLRRLAPGMLGGYDAILCCETLEHIPWDDAARVLGLLAATGTRHLIVSVPWSGMELQLGLHAAPGWLRSWLALRWPARFRRFVPDTHPMGRRWELDFRGHSLAAWERLLAAGGWRISERLFTSPTRSAMHLCTNATSG